MPNPSNKQELVATMADGYAKLNEQIAKMSEEAISATFDFAADPKKCGVRWQYDRCLRDLLIHLYEWQVLMREFVNNIREGHPRDYLPDEYRKNYHEMDKMLVPNACCGKLTRRCSTSPRASTRRSSSPKATTKTPTPPTWRPTS